MSDMELLSGEPMKLTAREWESVPIIEPASGPAVMGYSVADAQHDRAPDEPVMTREEWLAQTGGSR